MAISAWVAGKLYQPNDLVRPASTPPALPSAPTNPGFESGDSGWDKGSGFTIENGASGPTAFSGTWKAVCAFTGESEIVNDNEVPVLPGQTITARCMCAQSATADFNNRGKVGIKWFTSGAVFISRSDGNVVEETNSGTPWRQSTVTAVAPATAAFGVICGVSTRDSGGGTTSFDEFSWDYTFTVPDGGVVYRATQADAGFSGVTEPVWPGLGMSVTDNEVTWEGVLASRVTWEAHPILVSGGSEPVFPTASGGTVLDNTIIWVADTGFVSEAPQSSVVTIGASKVFAGDEDIIPFCATVNPKDWTTRQDAGYLAYGLQAYGANPVAALALYRGNLVAFNSEGFQMWQIDEDPAAMTILDAVPVGSTYAVAVQPVGNDLLILSQQGIRNFGIAAASTNLAAGSFGEPIDPLIVASLGLGDPTASCFYPARGQYWLAFGATAYVLTMIGKKPNWSRYTFPEGITDFTLAGETLYIRTATHKVWALEDIETQDDVVLAHTIPDPTYLLLLHADGTNGSTAFPDDSGYDNVMTPTGATVSDTQVEFGTGSASFTGSGSSLTTPNRTEWNFTQGDFTVDMWVYVSGLASRMFLMCKQNDLFQTPFNLYIESTRSLTLNITDGGAGDIVFINDPGVFPDGVLTHVAVTRSGNTYRLFKNGVVVASATNAGVPYLSSGNLAIGTGQFGTAPLTGHLDEIRIKTGAAWTADFTPPVAPYAGTIIVPASGIDFYGVLQWPFLDAGNLGVQKTLEGFDLVCTGTVDVQFAYNQKDITQVTTAYTVDGDTLTTDPIPFPLSAPSYSLKLTFHANQDWEWNAANLYVSDNRGGGARG